MRGLLERPYMRPRPSYMPKYWPVPSDCVLYLEGQQDAYSATIRDLSGNGNHGTIAGATWARNSQGLWGLSFDGVDDVVSCGTPASLNALTGNMYIEAWINSTSLGESDTGRIVDKAQGAAEGFYLFTEATATVQFKCFIGGVGKTATAPINKVPFGTTTHIMGGHDGSNVLVIVNGVLTTGDATGGAITAHATRAFTVGNRSAKDVTFDGLIYLLRVDNIAPSVALAKAHYQQERHLFGV